MADGRRVVFSGYYGFRNAGDEAVLAAALDLLAGQRPDVEVTVLSGDVAHTERMHGVDAVPRGSPAAVWRTLRGADLFISGGGSLLQDATSLRSTPYYLLMIILARLAGLPVIFYAQGVGPLRNRFLRRLTAIVLEGLDRISVRDPLSGDLLREIGLRRDDVLVSTDPVFSLPFGERPEGGNGNGGGAAIGLSPRPSPGAGETHRVLTEACRRLLLEDPGRRLVIIPMHFRGDLEVARAMAAALVEDPGGSGSRVERERVRILEEERSPGDLLRVFEGLDVLIGMRLHALIMALRASRPVVGISYDPKVDALLGAFGQRAVGTTDDTDPGEVCRAVRELLGRERPAAGIAERVEQLAERARREMEAICEVFLSG